MAAQISQVLSSDPSERKRARFDDLVIDASKFDAKTRDYSAKSLAASIKDKKEQRLQFLQQLIDKTKADKEAAFEDSVAQAKYKARLERLLEEQAKMNARDALRDELDDLGKFLETKEKELTAAHVRSQSVLGRITQQILNVAAAAGILGQPALLRLQRTYAEQEERRNTVTYLNAKVENIKEKQKTFEALSEDEVKEANIQLGKQAAYKELNLTELPAIYLKREEEKASQFRSELDRIQYDIAYYKLKADMEGDIQLAQIVRDYKMDDLLLNKAVTESLTGEEVEQRTNEIHKEAREKEQKHINKFNEEVLRLNAHYALKPSANNSYIKCIKAFAKTGVFNKTNQNVQEFVEANVAAAGIVREVTMAEDRVASLLKQSFLNKNSNSVAAKAVSNEFANSEEKTPSIKL